MSFVDMHPSESTRSKVIRVAARSARSSWSESSTASVVMTTSIVASPGASMPAPLAIPPTAQPASERRSASLGRVSVVMIASAAPSPESPASAVAACATPAVSFATSSCSPMRPVEHTRTSPAETPRASPTASAVACVVWKPREPV